MASRILCTGAMLFLLHAPAVAASTILDDAKCGTEVTPTKSVLGSFIPSYVYEGETAALPKFIAGTYQERSEDGTLEGTLSLLFFSKADSSWKGVGVEPQASFSNVYVSPESGGAFLFSQIDIEGAGQSFATITTKDGFQTFACGELPGPSASGGNDYISLRNFVMNSQGVGSVEEIVEPVDGSASRCYRAQTGDYGTTWKLREMEQCIEGSFRPLDQPQGSETLRELLSSR